MPKGEKWIPWDQANVPDPQKRTGVHNLGGAFGKKSRVHYRWCTNCGLLNLRNDATRRAFKKPCVWYD